jgi:hypothetical protein
MRSHAAPLVSILTELAAWTGAEIKDCKWSGLLDSMLNTQIQCSGWRIFASCKSKSSLHATKVCTLMYMYGRGRNVTRQRCDALPPHLTSVFTRKPAAAASSPVLRWAWAACAATDGCLLVTAPFAFIIHYVHLESGSKGQQGWLLWATGTVVVFGYWPFCFVIEMR